MAALFSLHPDAAISTVKVNQQAKITSRKPISPGKPVRLKRLAGRSFGAVSFADCTVKGQLTKMKIIEVAAYGGPQELKLVDVGTASAGPGQVVIAVEAIGVGAVDIELRSGAHMRPVKPPLTPGGEVAGSVLRVGDGVDESWIGRRVYAYIGIGGYAEQVVTELTKLTLLPDNVSAVDAVALGVNAMTAVFSLETAPLKEGERVLVREAGGGIGLAVVQHAVLKGASVTAVSSSDGRMARLKSLGAATVLTRTDIEAVSREFDVIVDPVAGPDMANYISHLGMRGRYVLRGTAGGWPDPEFGMSVLMKGINSVPFSVFSLGSINDEQAGSALTEIFALASGGKLKPVIETIYPIHEAAQAHAHLESGNVFGRLVLTI